MRKLKIKGLNNTYKKINKEIKDIYYSPEKNNLIVFNPMETPCNTYTITHGIAKDAYDYLINILNSEGNLIIVWEQIEQTTSDYTIFRGLNVKEYVVKPYSETLSRLNKMRQLRQFKYTENNNGIEKQIIFDRRDEKVLPRLPLKNNYIDHVNGFKQDNSLGNLRIVAGLK